MIRLAIVASVAAGLAPIAPIAVAQESWEISGGWSGGYVCNQGETALHVAIRKESAPDQVTAIFSFGPTKANPGVPRGAYRMRGSFDLKDKQLRLHGETWLSQPSGYVMVDLDGLMRGSGLYISGNVLGPGCSQFDLHRDGAEAIG